MKPNETTTISTKEYDRLIAIVYRSCHALEEAKIVLNEISGNSCLVSVLDALEEIELWFKEYE